MKKCKDCGIEINEKNKVLREKGRWRPICYKCFYVKYGKRKLERQKERLAVYLPCNFCKKVVKRINSTKTHFCSDECRFFDKIEGNANECWEWKDFKDKDGYGVFSVKRKTIRAHRYSYELFLGKIPKGKFICHTCDNPSCVNPNHLWIGTNSDNINDAYKKGRIIIKRGTASSFSKLTKKMIKEIRILDKKMKRYKIAEKFNVSGSTISNLLNNRTYVRS